MAHTSHILPVAASKQSRPARLNQSKFVFHAISKYTHKSCEIINIKVIFNLDLIDMSYESKKNAHL